MTRSRGIYQIFGSQSVEDLQTQLNTLLGELSDRLDKIEGLRGTATIESDLNLTGSAVIYKGAMITGDVTVGGTQAVTGTVTISGLTQILSSLNVQGNAVLDGDNLLAGHFRVISPTDEDVVSETVSWEGDSYATGNANFGGNLIVGGDSYLAGELDGPNVFKLTEGIIAMWYGSIATIPDGWALCDGNTYNGFATPDLTDRFIVAAGDTGAGDKYDPGDIAGTGDPTVLTTGEATVGVTTTDAAGAGTTVVTGLVTDPHTHDLNVTLVDKYTLIPSYALVFIMYVGT